MAELGTDRHGLWLGAPRGTIVRRGAEPAKPHPHGFVKLVPDGDRWWTAIFNDRTGPRYEIYVDIATPPVREGDVIRAVDLDLDVVRRRDGTVALLDEGEFDEHLAAFGYPESVVVAARGAGTAVAAALEQNEAPFDGTAQPWLARLDLL